MRISELENKLRRHAVITKSVMQAPFDLNEEIKNMEVHAMSKPKSIILKRSIAIAAVLALCIITVTMTPLANPIKGFFSDIIRFDGAIIGTQYENATHDIKVDVLELTTDDGNVIIPLDLTFENPTEAPFPYIQEVAVAEYKILDSNNKEIIKTKFSAEDGEKGTVSDGKVFVNLSLNDAKFKSGENYTIVIKKMYGLSKADAPLHITGTWECQFKK